MKKFFYITSLIFALSLSDVVAGVYNHDILVNHFDQSVVQQIMVRADKKFDNTNLVNFLNPIDCASVEVSCANNGKAMFDEKGVNSEAKSLQLTVTPNRAYRGILDKSKDPEKTAIPPNPQLQDIINNTTMGIKYKARF
jgi:hypothetical protein